MEVMVFEKRNGILQDRIGFLYTTNTRFRTEIRSVCKLMYTIDENSSIYSLAAEIRLASVPLFYVCTSRKVQSQSQAVRRLQFMLVIPKILLSLFI